MSSDTSFALSSASSSAGYLPCGLLGRLPVTSLAASSVASSAALSASKSAELSLVVSATSDAPSAMPLAICHVIYLLSFYHSSLGIEIGNNLTRAIYQLHTSHNDF